MQQAFVFHAVFDALRGAVFVVDDVGAAVGGGIDAVDAAFDFERGIEREGELLFGFGGEESARPGFAGGKGDEKKR